MYYMNCANLTTIIYLHICFMNIVSKPEAKLAIAISGRRNSVPMANENWRELCFEILAAELGWGRVGLTL